MRRAGGDDGQPIPNHKSQWGALSGVPGNRRKHCKRSLGRAQGVRIAVCCAWRSIRLGLMKQTVEGLSPEVVFQEPVRIRPDRMNRTKEDEG